MSQTRPLAIAIMGPTASGKTDAALAIAKHYPCEIISVDSALIYQTMDIGTAKPTAEELQAVKHHLIDIIDPSQAYSAAQFREDAIRLVMEIAQKGKLPLLVGGTMLYFKALSDGLNDLPSADPKIREKITQEATTLGWPKMHEKLAQLDLETAQRIKPNDAQRIERALEIIQITGQPLSQLHNTPKQNDLPFDILWISLEPSDRAKLHERIAKRFEKMMQGGQLVEEVKRLKARGDLNLSLPSMRCVGYRQTWQYLDGECNLKEMFDKGVAATRQLAKRQLTWLRAMPHRHVIDCLAPDAVNQVLALINQHVKKTS